MTILNLWVEAIILHIYTNTYIGFGYSPFWELVLTMISSNFVHIFVQLLTCYYVLIAQIVYKIGRNPGCTSQEYILSDIYIYIHICIYRTSIYMCMYVCVYIYIYIYKARMHAYAFL